MCVSVCWNFRCFSLLCSLEKWLLSVSSTYSHAIFLQSMKWRIPRCQKVLRKFQCLNLVSHCFVKLEFESNIGTEIDILNILWALFPQENTLIVRKEIIQNIFVRSNGYKAIRVTAKKVRLEKQMITIYWSQTTFLNQMSPKYCGGLVQ